MENVINGVNREDGFRIKGWFNPACNDEGVLTESFSVHVCSVGPSSSMDISLKNYRYGSVAGNSFIWLFSEIEIILSKSYK